VPGGDEKSSAIRLLVFVEAVGAMASAAFIFYGVVFRHVQPGAHSLFWGLFPVVCWVALLVTTIVLTRLQHESRREALGWFVCATIVVLAGLSVPAVT